MDDDAFEPRILRWDTQGIPGGWGVVWEGERADGTALVFEPDADEPMELVSEVMSFAENNDATSSPSEIFAALHRQWQERLVDQGQDWRIEEWL